LGLHFLPCACLVHDRSRRRREEARSIGAFPQENPPYSIFDIPHRISRRLIPINREPTCVSLDDDRMAHGTSKTRKHRFIHTVSQNLRPFPTVHRHQSARPCNTTSRILKRRGTVDHSQTIVGWNLRLLLIIRNITCRKATPTGRIERQRYSLDC